MTALWSTFKIFYCQYPHFIWLLPRRNVTLGIVFEKSTPKIKRMKKFIAAAFLAIAFVFTANAQAGDYRDLLTLFVDEKFDKVVEKATRYTEGEKTKKDALPYLFISMSYFEMSKRDKWKTKVPDAFKLSLKSIKSYAKYDPQREFASEYEDFFAELRTALIADGELMLDQQKFTKAKTDYQYLLNLEANDAGAQIYLGITLVAMKSKKEADMAFAAAKKMLTEKTASTATPELKNFLKAALITYALQLSDAGSSSTAKEWMELGLDIFKDDKEYNVTYETVAG